MVDELKQINMQTQSQQQPIEDNRKGRMLKEIPDNSKKQTVFIVLSSVLVVLAGVFTGWQLSGGSVEGSEGTKITNVTPGDEGNPDEAGVEDESVFETVEEGVLVEGGFEGEGTHHLERGDDPSKYAYLTSAVINLDNFNGRKVKIWGNTISGQKAGWLIEVGKIKALD